MINRILAMVKPVALGIFAITLFALAQSEARADEVFVAGFTNGCFGVACAPGATATSGGLTYSNSTFQGTTANGFRGIGGNPNPGSNFNNLGSISLSTAPQSYNTPFTLQVTFTAPQGINGSNTATFTATITGTVEPEEPPSTSRLSEVISGPRCGVAPPRHALGGETLFRSPFPRSGSWHRPTLGL
jgi:hypothetical protein